jgi:DegV family protein with EDD domain
VDDLFFLKRGGRISATTAVAGSILQIKPIIVVDEKGCLNSVAKARGRKGSLRDLYSRFKATENMKELPYVFISNSDCIDDVKKIEDMIKADYPQVKVVISDIGPVIGAHTGPGAIAVCYLGTTIKGSDK